MVGQDAAGRLLPGSTLAPGGAAPQTTTCEEWRSREQGARLALQGQPLSSSRRLSTATVQVSGPRRAGSDPSISVVFLQISPDSELQILCNGAQLSTLAPGHEPVCRDRGSNLVLLAETPHPGPGPTPPAPLRRRTCASARRRRPCRPARRPGPARTAAPTLAVTIRPAPVSLVTGRGERRAVPRRRVEEPATAAVVTPRRVAWPDATPGW